MMGSKDRRTRRSSYRTETPQPPLRDTAGEKEKRKPESTLISVSLCQPVLWFPPKPNETCHFESCFVPAAQRGPCTSVFSFDVGG